MPFSCSSHFLYCYAAAIPTANAPGQQDPPYHVSTWRWWDTQPVLRNIWLGGPNPDYPGEPYFYDWTTVDNAIASLQADQPGAKVIVTTGMIPTKFSSQPDQANNKYPDIPGGKAPPEDLAVYQQAITDIVAHVYNAGHLFAVEGWNEPWDGGSPEHYTGQSWDFFSGTLTDLANIQKAVYNATKSVSAGIPVLSPALNHLASVPQVLAATTTAGEPITNFFDVFAWHGYDTAPAAWSGPGQWGSFESVSDTLRAQLTAAGAGATPMMDTEHGWSDWSVPGYPDGLIEWFNGLSAAERGQVWYDLFQAAHDRGDYYGMSIYSHDYGIAGMPVNVPEIRAELENAYNDFDDVITGDSQPPSTTPVQTQGFHADYLSTGTFTLPALALNVSVGNILWVALSRRTNGVTASLSDSLGNGTGSPVRYNLIGSVQCSDTHWVDHFWTPITHGGSCAITVNLTGSSERPAVIVHEYPGNWTLDKHDERAGIWDGVNQPTSNSITPGYPNELIVSAVHQVNGAPASQNAGAGFNPRQGCGPNSIAGLSSEDKALTSTSPTTANFTYGPGNDTYGIVTATFRPPAQGATAFLRSAGARMTAGMVDLTGGMG